MNILVYDSFLKGYILCIKLKLNKTKKQKPQLKPKLAFGFESLQVRNYSEKVPFFPQVYVTGKGEAKAY